MCDKIHYDELDERVTSLEQTVQSMRRDLQTGLGSVNSNIETLSQQITNMDRRIIEEKQKWGETLRGIAKLSARVLLGGAAAAIGINLTKAISMGLFN